MGFVFSNLKIIQIPVTPLLQNCLLMFDKNTQQGVLVDPGGEGYKILKKIEEYKVKVEEIWITHCHFDHIGAASFISDACGGIPILGSSEQDKILLQHKITDILDSYQISDDTVRDMNPTRFLSEGESLNCGAYSFNVLHTPGHSPGHVVFYCKELKFMIAGDLLFKGSIGRSDLIGGNHQQLMISLKNKIMPLDDNIQFSCGHGQSSTLGYEKAHNPFLQALKF